MAECKGREMKSAYGYCPVCGAPGSLRERRPNGNDTCVEGHIYASRQALEYPKKPRGCNRFRVDGAPNETDWTWNVVCSVAESNATRGHSESNGTEIIEQWFPGTETGYAHWKPIYFVSSIDGIVGAPCEYHEDHFGAATAVFDDCGNLIGFG